MARGLSDDFLEDLKQRNNIVNIISRYMPLERKGKNYWGRCPFHLEKTPSFSVNEVDQFYHCFGCKASGNIFKFVMDVESVSFMEAVRMIAEWSGVEVPIDAERQEDYQKQKKEREVMTLCMKECAKHYHENLQKSKVAQDYLKNRGITPEMITKFGIGYSSSYTDIIEYLEKKGYKKDLLYRLGIIKEKDGRFYDAIGERIAFPIINIYGDVVAFSGRTLKKQVDYAKYINTGDTPIFSKSKNLFAINLVKKAKQAGTLKEIIIVEGQTDVIALHKAGYSGTVASLGTALTVDQARLIKRFTDNVIICYDGDFAGTKATMRGLDILKHENLNVRVASLPDGMDPDELIQKQGNEAFNKVIKNALPLIEYKLVVLKSKYNLKEFDGKARYVDEAIEILSDIGEVEAEVYLDLISDMTGVYKDFLRKKLKDKNLVLASNNMVSIKAVQREEVQDDNIQKAELCLLANILENKNYVKDINKVLSAVSSKYDNIKDALKNKSSRSDFIARLEESNQEMLGGILNYNFSEDELVNKQLYEDCLWLVYKNNLLDRQSQLTARLSCANAEERREIMKELMKISQQINNKIIE